MSEAVLIGCFIVLAILFLIYCIAGTVVRYRRGVRSFPDVIPHCSFWVDTIYWILCCGRSRRDQRHRDQRITQLPEFSENNNSTNNGGGDFNMRSFNFGRPLRRNNNQNRSVADDDDEQDGMRNSSNSNNRHHRRVLSNSSPSSSMGNNDNILAKNDFRNLQQSTTGSGLDTTVMNDDDDDDTNLHRHDGFVSQPRSVSGTVVVPVSATTSASNVIPSNNNTNTSGPGLSQSELDRLDDENDTHHTVVLSPPSSMQS